MIHLTTVAPKEKHEDEDCNNISPETGIFITHSPTKTWSKNNNYSKMYLPKHNIIILCTMCMITMCWPQQCLATLAAPTTLQERSIGATPPPHKECGSVFIRYNCEDFEELKTCTAITGPLVISLTEKAKCNITDLVFENLREITDFLMITHVSKLDNIKNMFPNLTVIRGRRIFTNYAMLITNCDDLEMIEFNSLLAIQRGSVVIANCPKLCFTEKVNFNRLTLSRGQNNIFFDEDAKCPKDEVLCYGCKTDSCWSNDLCQKFNSDSVLTPLQDPALECHQQCLGGCYNRTAEGCVVCKGYTDHGTCVEKCPSDKYPSSHYWRCYTREECVNKKFYIHENECVDSCPVGHRANNDTMECDVCVGKCRKICLGNYDNEIYITDISGARLLRGCDVINASVIVDIYEYFDQRELTEHLQDIRQIRGFLKIHRSPYLTSLNFFKNLEKIHGLVLEENLYALVIYNNKNLTEFWNVKPGFKILNGGMYIHANDKVCNRHIRQFRESIKHDKSLDYIQKSDQDVFCSPAVLNLYVEIQNHSSILLYWLKENTFSEVEIIYRSVPHKAKLKEKSEIDTDVCDRIKWNRELKFAHELQKEDRHYTYTLQNLEPQTRYAILVKTFNGDNDKQEARSEIKYATTKSDIPRAPKFALKRKTSSEFYIEFSPAEVKSDGPPIVDYFILEVYSLPDDKDSLDTRDYCDEPSLDFKENDIEDFDDCCSRLEKEKKDQDFLSRLQRDFACSLDQNEYCKPLDVYTHAAAKRELYITKRFEGWETQSKISSLEHFHLYVMQMSACNRAGCSSHTILSARTNYSLASDNVYFSFCKENETSEYKVYFSEPNFPNGYITSYGIHFRNSTTIDDNMTADNNELYCVTRLEHERSKYVYVLKSNLTFHQAAIRVHSLARHTFIEWKNITKCSDGIMTSIRSYYYVLCVLSIVVLVLIFVLICQKITGYSMMGCMCSWIPAHTGWGFVRPRRYMAESTENLDEGQELVSLGEYESPQIEFGERDDSE